MIREVAQPVIALAWRDEALAEEFEAEGAEVVALPTSRFDHEYRKIRRLVDQWHSHRMASPSAPIDARRQSLHLTPTARAMRSARFLKHRLQLAIPGAVRRMLRAEGEAVRDHTNLADFLRLVDEIRPDYLLTLTPFNEQEALVVRAAHLQSVPCCAAILSFDNITCRGWFPVTFDRYLVWNHWNAAEIRRGYPEAASRPVTVVGAPQFDFYWDESYLWPEDVWRRELGLPQDRPVILFGAGPPSIAPHEPRFLEQLDQAIESGEIPGRPIVLFRRHPMDPMDRWRSILEQARNVRADDPWRPSADLRHFNVSRSDVERLATTLKHSVVHVNVSSTMTVDGAIFDRPQIGPAYDDSPGGRYDRVTRELYDREHFLPITRSGGLALAFSRAELVAAVREALSNPAKGQAGRAEIVRQICAFSDGRSATRVFAEVASFLQSAPSRVCP
ncbi:MAG: hypothetical protein AB7I30_02980 [Isosphaeraceae bacterium]